MVLTYKELKRFLEIILPSVVDLGVVPPESRPMAVLSRLEAQSQARAMKGLKMAVTDVLVPLARVPAEELDRLSRQLVEAKAPSIALVRAWASRKARKVLERGHIQSDEEFEHMKGLLDTTGLGEQERARIQAMVDAYEFGS